jgi:hypothetical protein
VIEISSVQIPERDLDRHSDFDVLRRAATYSSSSSDLRRRRLWWLKDDAPFVVLAALVLTVICTTSLSRNWQGVVNTRVAGESPPLWSRFTFHGQ